MAPALSDGGRGILSGILVEERALLVEVLDTSGWQIIDEDVEDIWWSATISRR